MSAEHAAERRPQAQVPIVEVVACGHVVVEGMVRRVPVRGRGGADVFACETPNWW